VRIGFDEALAHRIEAGADLFLMPSLYEPCGLNQIYSLKYGTIPIVRATGGLRDTVKDYTTASGGNGFVFDPYEPSELLRTVDRALELFARKREWTALIRRAMNEDFSWNRSAKAYFDLYQKLIL
jgi:starch synthase